MRWGNIFFVLGLLTACNSDYGVTGLVQEPEAPDIIQDITIPDSEPPLEVNTETSPEPSAEIQVTPIEHYFGDVVLECPTKMWLEIKSVGQLDLIVDKLHYSGPDDFMLSVDYLTYGGLPWILTPGDSAFVSVEYAPDAEEYDLGYFTVESNDLTDPVIIVGQDGDGVRAGTALESFTQEEQARVDILFVIDNSCSMSVEQAELSLNADLFISPIAASGADFHIGTITTDDISLRGPVITPSTADIIDEFRSQIVAGISGDATEKGLEMARDALLPGSTAGSGGSFFRDDANLVVIVVSDEDDFSTGLVVEYTDDIMATKILGTTFSLHAVAGLYPSSTCANASPAERYDTAVYLTSGQFFDICTSDWGYQVEQMAEDTILPILSYPLAEDPIVETIEVYVDGSPLPAGWYYDPVTNSVVFELDYAPPEGSDIAIIYGYYGECP
tara:strand:+ start:1626 stop:2957 length:1332 start_codon:yes stop_codon:yes gene_type:complete